MRALTACEHCGRLAAGAIVTARIRSFSVGILPIGDFDKSLIAAAEFPLRRVVDRRRTMPFDLPCHTFRKRSCPMAMSFCPLSPCQSRAQPIGALRAASQRRADSGAAGRARRLNCWPTIGRSSIAPIMTFKEFGLADLAAQAAPAIGRRGARLHAPISRRARSDWPSPTGSASRPAINRRFFIPAFG